jgi:ubiquinone/menaquinone biosynthesis C-methylase UbiE
VTSRDDVRVAFDRIAEQFSATREHPWPEVAAFVERAEHADVALDVGCGNGRHAELLAGVADRVLAVDASTELLALARERATRRTFGAALLAGDAARLPLRSGRVDLAVYVATLHHLPDRELRLASLDELARVLAPAGRALVSAWSTAHDRFDRESGFDTELDWTLPDGTTVPRFYHVYDPAEFRADVAESDLALLELTVSSGNCYAQVRPEEKRP